MSHLLSFRSHSGYYWNTYSCFHLILNPSTPYIYLFLFTQREKYYLLLYIRHYPEMSHLPSYRSHSGYYWNTYDPEKKYISWFRTQK